MHVSEEVLLKMPSKSGRGNMGKPAGRLNNTTLEIRDMICRICGDPLEGMARIAKGDVVALGYMTEKEMKEPPSFDRSGRVVRPSGQERALSYIPVDLRAKMYNELAQYCYGKRRVVFIEDENGGNALANITGGGVVLYLPHNNRELPSVTVKKKPT